MNFQNLKNLSQEKLWNVEGVVIAFSERKDMINIEKNI